MYSEELIVFGEFHFFVESKQAWSHFFFVRCAIFPKRATIPLFGSLERKPFILVENWLSWFSSCCVDQSFFNTWWFQKAKSPPLPFLWYIMADKEEPHLCVRDWVCCAKNPFRTFYGEMLLGRWPFSKDVFVVCSCPSTTYMLAAIFGNSGYAKAHFPPYSSPKTVYFSYVWKIYVFAIYLNLYWHILLVPHAETGSCIIGKTSHSI